MRYHSRVRTWLVRFVLTMTLSAALPGAFAAEAEKKVFDLPADNAEKTLRLFSVQSSREVLFSTEMTAGVQTNAVKGEFEPQIAAEKMLAGTPLVLVSDEKSGVLRVSRAPGPNGASPANSPGERSRDTQAKPAGDEVIAIDKFVVSASRTLQDPRYTASSVSLVSLAELKTLQVDDLKTSLNQQPGVAVVNTGTVGGQSSVYIRGAYPHHTLFILDGVRMNDRSATYNSFLGGADLSGFDRMEILRGPQSPMYGSAAMGGVVLMDTARGSGDPSGAVSVTAGSFDTFSSTVAVKGGAGKAGYSASVNRYQTANDQPANDYENWGYSTRLNYALTPVLEVGVTFRGQDAENEVVGSRLYYAPGFVESANYLGTVYADWKASETVTSHFTAALHRREYLWSDAYGDSEQTNNRRIFDWQTAWKPADALELADFLIEQGQQMPERFKRRDIQTFVADAVIDWAYAEYNATRSPEPYLSDLLPRVDGEWDLTEQIPSKYHKLIGMRAQDAQEWETAIKHLERSTELHAAAGCARAVGSAEPAAAAAPASAQQRDQARAQHESSADPRPEEPGRFAVRPAQRPDQGQKEDGSRPGQAARGHPRQFRGSRTGLAQRADPLGGHAAAQRCVRATYRRADAPVEQGPRRPGCHREAGQAPTPPRVQDPAGWQKNPNTSVRGVDPAARELRQGGPADSHPGRRKNRVIWCAKLGHHPAETSVPRPWHRIRNQRAGEPGAATNPKFTPLSEALHGTR